MVHHDQAEAANTFQFVFTASRGGDRADGLQLAEVELFGENGQVLRVQNASSPGGKWRRNQDPGRAIDGDIRTKWLDSSFASTGRSTLVLRLATPMRVVGYMLYTADEPKRRDPTGWWFGSLRGHRFHLLTTMHAAKPPSMRGVRYQSTPFDATSSSAGPHKHELNETTHVGYQQLLPSWSDSSTAVVIAGQTRVLLDPRVSRSIGAAIAPLDAEVFIAVSGAAGQSAREEWRRHLSSGVFDV